jgi:hypothetical protein
MSIEGVLDKGLRHHLARQRDQLGAQRIDVADDLRALPAVPWK